MQSARAPWADLVLVCRKCAKRAGAKGFRKELKAALKARGAGRSMRLVEVGCLDLCPKKRVTLALGRDLAGRRLIIAGPGQAAAVAELIIPDAPGA